MICISQRIKKTMEAECSAIQVLIQNSSNQYDEIVNLFYQCEGKIVFMGIGKSGHIGKKIAASFSSTGTPSFFVHSAEACHGDFGMIEQRDIAVLISNSGTTQEVVQDIEPLRKIGCKTVAFTANPDSVLAKGCDYSLIIPKCDEADDLNLAPTVSSTLMLVLGDAIACTLATMRDFKREDFYKFHPGGALGSMLKGGKA